MVLNTSLSFPDSSVGKESACSAGDPSLIPGSARSAGEGVVPTPVFWPGEFHGLYSPWGRKESDMTERLAPVYVKCNAFGKLVVLLALGVGLKVGQNKQPLLCFTFF